MSRVHAKGPSLASEGRQEGGSSSLTWMAAGL